MNDDLRDCVMPLAVDEVRVYTIVAGDREAVRAATRRLLAALTGIAVDIIAYDYGPKGKPVLRSDPGLHFSVTHSGATSMIAVTRVAPVGIDVERVRTVPQAKAILRRFFSEDDIGAILTSDDRDLRFVDAWTRAEAVVKVRGASVWEVATPDPSVTVRTIAAPDGYAASVAVAAPTWRLRQYAYPIDRSDTT